MTLKKSKINLINSTVKKKKNTSNSLTRQIISHADYISKINNELMPAKTIKYTVLDLFAGCGGLSLGFESVGFKSFGIETKKKCCEAYNLNLKGRCTEEFITTKTDFPKSDVVIGGPPCQPFSVFGNQLGNNDPRNGFPAFITAIKKIKPKIWMFENVRGILYRNKDYFESSIKKLKNLGYVVDYHLLNAVNFDVPQNRIRVIAIGHDGSFEFPVPSDNMVTSGEALKELACQITKESQFLTPSMDKYVAVYEKKSRLVTPRDLHLDKPARTVTCRNLAGATSDMHRIKLPDGRRRRLTVREGARLQSFPDWFEFVGADTDMFNQIGNAMPPMFARAIAIQIKKYLDKN